MESSKSPRQTNIPLRSPEPHELVVERTTELSPGKLPTSNSREASHKVLQSCGAGFGLSPSSALAPPPCVLLSTLRASAEQKIVKSMMAEYGSVPMNVRRSTSMLPASRNIKAFCGRHVSPEARLCGKKQKKEYQLGVVSRRHRKLGFNPKEYLVVQLSALGFTDDQIQAVVFGTNVERVEDAMTYLAKSEDETWEHTFVSERDVMKCYSHKYCLACEQQQEKMCNRRASTPSGCGNRIVPAETRSVQFVRNGIAMRNLRYQQAIRRRRNTANSNTKTALKNNESVSNISYMSDLSHDPKPSTAGPANDNSTRELIPFQPQRVAEDVCFACGDDLCSHSPDYNANLARQADAQQENDLEASFRANPPVSPILLPTSASSHTGTEDEKSISRCPICLEQTPSQYITLPCGHRLCQPCMKDYITNTLDTVKRSTIKCPAPSCNYLLTADFVRKSLGSGSSHWRKFNARQREITLLRSGRLLYCPQCGRPLLVEVPPSAPQLLPSGEEDFGQTSSLILCQSCREVICKKCCAPWHEDMTCAENVTKQYDRLVRGWEWQTCPSCRAPVRMAPQCGHMMCRQCFAVFCIYCRKRKHAPGSVDKKVEFGCCLEGPGRNVSSVGSIGCRKSFATAFIAYFLILLLSPLLALLLVPYIVVQNYCESLRRQDCGKRIRPDGLPSPSPNVSVSMPPSFLSTEQQNSSLTLNVMSATETRNKAACAEFAEIGSGPARRCVVFRLALVGALAAILTPVTFVGINVVAVVGLVTYIVS